MSRYWSEDYAISQLAAKHEWLVEHGYDEVPPMEFYRQLFPKGSLQDGKNDGSGKGNIVATRLMIPKVKAKYEQIMREENLSVKRRPQYVIGDDLAELEKAIEPRSGEFALIPPISYFGRTHSAKNADCLFSLTIDIDLVGVAQLKNLMKQFSEKSQRPILPPSYIASSGTGVHLYYFLKEPVRLYPNMQPIYSALKKALIEYVWWSDLVSQKEDYTRDLKGVTQGFRAVGSLTKLGYPYIVKAYKVSGKRYSLEEIRDSIPNCGIVLLPPKAQTSLNMARLQWPEWYERRIVRKEPKRERPVFHQNRAMYERFKEVMRNQIRPGGRYHSIVALCATGLKCGIPDDEIRKDANEFLEYYESITDSDTNHFMQSDIDEALKSALMLKNRSRTLRTTTEWIEDNCHIKLHTNRRKKGERKPQKEHLEEARAIKAVRKKMGKITDGRPSKASVVQEWQQEHPEGTKSECRSDTGLSYPTIRKHWIIDADRQQETGRLKRFGDIVDLPSVKSLDDISREMDKLTAYINTLSREQLSQWQQDNVKEVDELMKLFDEFKELQG